MTNHKCEMEYQHSEARNGTLKTVIGCSKCGKTKEFNLQLRGSETPNVQINSKKFGTK